MVSHWRAALLGDFASLTRGISYRSSELAVEGQGAPFLNLKCVARGGGYRGQGLKYFTGRVKPEQILKGGDLLLAVTDLTQARDVIGAPLRVPAELDGLDATFSLDLVKLTLKRSVADISFVSYLLETPSARSYLQSLSTGTTVLHLSPKQALRLPVVLPPLDVQREIAGLLGTLDDLMRTNRRLIRHALSMAMTAVEHEQRSGKGSPRALADIVAFENRQRIPLSANEREAIPGPYPYYGAAGQMDTVGKYIFDTHRILVGEDGTVMRPAGAPVVQSVWGRYWVNNHAHVLRGTEVSNDLLRLLLLTADVSALVTGAVQPKLNMRNLKTLQMFVPRSPEIERLAGELGSMERELVDENRGLQETRDELLPLLLSGRVLPGEVAV